MFQQGSRCTLRRGFTLIELLVVVAIVGILIGLLLPAIQRAREGAARIQCIGNLRQLGLALHEYHDSQGVLPPSSVLMSERSGKYLLSWRVVILPYVEQAPLYEISLRAYQADPVPYHNPPHVGLSTVMQGFICTSDARLLEPLTDEDAITAAFTSYVGIAGATEASGGGVLGSARGVRLTDVTDGTSNTLMVGERPPPENLLAGGWYSLGADANWPDAFFKGPDPTLVVLYPTSAIEPGACMGPFRFGPGRLDNPCDRYHYWSLHPGGSNFLLADGSARFLPYSAENVIVPLATYSGGEVVSLP